MVYFQPQLVQRPENQEHQWCRSSLEGRRRPMSQLKLSDRRQISLPLPSCSVQALKGLSDAHPRWGGPSALLSPPIQILISSRNTLTDAPRNHFNQISGLCVTPFSGHIKLTLHFLFLYSALFSLQCLLPSTRAKSLFLCLFILRLSPALEQTHQSGAHG